MIKVGLLSLFYFLLVFTASNNRVADAIYCYACNSNWEACGIKPKLDMLKYNKEPCNGPCKIWKDGNIVHRSCTYDTVETVNPRIGTSYCETDLCNHEFLAPSLISTPAPVVTNKTTARFTPAPVPTAPPRTPSTPAPVATSKTTIKITPKPVPTAAPRTSSTSAPVASSKTTIQITPKPVPTVAPRTSTTQPVSKSIMCYECNARTRACADPVDVAALESSKISCTGACVTYKNPTDGYLLYRGCLDKLTNGGSGTYLAAGGYTYKYCSTDLCNVDLTLTTKPIIQIITTKPLIPTAPPRVTTAGNTGSGNLITYDEFTRAVTKAGYPSPSLEKYTNYVNQLGPKGGITTKREAAMFLSQILWESDGLKATAEYACVQTGCPGVYGSSQYPGQSYYGRGYIQLSWNYNYEAASRALYGDDRLLRDANQVATNDEIAWATAFWFWRTNVGSRQEVKNGNFGSSTMAINGGLECNGPYQDKARKRFEIYKIVMKEYGVTEAPIERGCYN